MSNKTLYEIYKDICDCKDVEKEDLRLATLTYRSLLWFANHDVEEIYKNSNQDIFNKTRFVTNVTRYKKALNTVPSKWLGNENIPGTQKYQEKECICNNILDGFNKWKEDKKEEKYDIYKATYMQNPCNILTEENLNRLEEHCKKAIHYERGEIKREHEVTLDLLYKYKEQQAESEKKDKIIGKMIDNIMTHYQVKTIRKMCCPTCIIGEKACTYSGIHRNCIKQYFERKIVNGEE